MVGTVLHDAIHAGGKFLAPAECSICQALKSAQELKLGEPARRTHGVLSHKDGRAIPVSYSAAQVVLDGILQGAVMSFYDDSQRRQLEAELRKRAVELAESERRKTEFYRNPRA